MHDRSGLGYSVKRIASYEVPLTIHACAQFRGGSHGYAMNHASYASKGHCHQVYERPFLECRDEDLGFPFRTSPFEPISNVRPSFLGVCRFGGRRRRARWTRPTREGGAVRCIRSRVEHGTRPVFLSRALFLRGVYLGTCMRVVLFVPVLFLSRSLPNRG